MRKIVAVAMLAAMTTLGTVAVVVAGTGGHPRTGPRAGGPPHVPAAPEGGVERQEVSREQYDILVRQCRYPNTPEARERCRAQVREKYTVGAYNPGLDCRTYSGVTVCGTLELGPEERACVEESVSGGLSRRRAEVECHVFR